MGYPTVRVEGRITAIHRLRAAHAFGRPLPAGVVVHHADGSTYPDAPLVICQDADYHALLHQRMRVVKAGGNPNTQRLCSDCGLQPLSAFGQLVDRRRRHIGTYTVCMACDYWRKMRDQRARRSAVAIRRRHAAEVAA